MAAVALAGVLVVGLPAGASADPDSGPDTEGSEPSAQQVQDAKLRARAAASSVGQVQARLAGADNRRRQLDIAAQQAVENYSAAVHRRTQAEDAARRTAAQASAARRTAEQRRRAVAEVAAATYRLDPGLGAVSSYLEAAGPDALLDEVATVSMVSSSLGSRYDALRVSQSVSEVFDARARDALDSGRRTAAAAEMARQRVTAALAVQSRSVDALAERKRSLLARLARLQRVSVRLATARQQALERQARERAEDARRRADRRRRDDPPPDGGGGPARGQRERAVRYALAQLGEPYVFGADGPGSWDCSGLTMRAWEAAGVSMPHFARGQYWQSTSIRLSALRRGDLVFWADDPTDSNTIYHVAMYLGHGRMIHAPRPGRDVERRSLWYMGTPTHAARVS